MSLVIQLEVPEDIVSAIEEHGFCKKENRLIFKTFISSIINDVQKEFEHDFLIWLDNLSSEELIEIKNGKLL